MNTEYLDEYYADNARKLRRIVDRHLKHFGGICDKDLDDFYSLANEVFVQVMGSYDGSTPFAAYLDFCVGRKIKTEITSRNRYKRLTDRNSVSIDSPVSDDDDATFGDIIDSGFDLESTVIRGVDDSIGRALATLSGTQRKIVRLRMEDKNGVEICKCLHISARQYRNEMEMIRSHFMRGRRKTAYAASKPKHAEEKRMGRTSEKVRTFSASIKSCERRIQNGEILTNHNLQRSAGKWNSESKSNLIVTALNGWAIAPLILCEQPRDGGVDVWLADGWQRLSNLVDYINNEFAIGRRSRYANIAYQEAVKDENGNIVRDEVGKPVYEEKECCVLGKRFNKLPVALQSKLENYEIMFIEYLGCCEDEVGYHIYRHNLGQKMNASEKAITNMSNYTASVCHNLANHEFFTDYTMFTANDQKNKTTDRTVMEAIVATYFMEDWNKNPNEMALYVKDHVEKKHFDSLQENLDRLVNVISEENRSIFTPRDTFIWLAAFDKFAKLGVDDIQFDEFLTEFRSKLRYKKINGVSFDDMCAKATKDKKVVAGKIDHIEALILDYFGVRKNAPIDHLVVKQSRNRVFIDSVCENPVVEIACGNDYDARARVAMSSLYIYKEETTPTDAELQTATNTVYCEDLYEDVEAAAKYFDSLSVDVEDTAEIVGMHSVPMMIAITGFAVAKNIDDCLPEWIQNIKNRRFASYAEMKKDFTSFVAYSGERVG